MNLTGSIQNIQKLRGAAAIMVLLLHINGGEEQYTGPGGVLPESFDIGHAGVDLFFLISGFVMVFATRLPDKQNPFTFIRTRLIRIYPIYWLVLAATVLLFIIKEVVFEEQVDYTTVIADALLFPTGKLPFLVVAWTLIHEMYFYLVFMVSLCISRCRLPWFLIGWLIFLGWGSATGVASLHPATEILFHPLTAEFIAGVCIGLLIIDGARSWGTESFWIGSIWLIGTGAWRIYADLSVFPSGWQRVLLCLPPLALILYGAVVVELRSGRPEGLPGPGGCLLLKLGDASYALYLVHLPVLLVVGKLWTPLATPSVWDNVVLIGIWICAATGVALCIHEWVEKPLLRLLKRFWISASAAVFPSSSALSKVNPRR